MVIAGWAGKLRRGGYAIFDRDVATSLLRLSSSQNEYGDDSATAEEDRTAALEFLDDQIGEGLITDLVASAERVVAEKLHVTVFYDWKAATGERKASKDLVLRGSGSILPVSRRELAFYRVALDRIGDDGLFLRRRVGPLA